MKIVIIPYDGKTPVGKLAEAEMVFEEGPLAGLKLIGFTVWAGRAGTPPNVTFPARQYSVNGERRSFSLLRAVSDVSAVDAIKQRVVDAYEANGREGGQ